MPKRDILKFNKTLLDKPINLTRKRVVKNNKLALEPLPEPLKPTKLIHYSETSSKTTKKSTC